MSLQLTVCPAFIRVQHAQLGLGPASPMPWSQVSDILRPFCQSTLASPTSVPPHTLRSHMSTPNMAAGTTAASAASNVLHHYAEVNGTKLHYVSAGSTGSPILLVHGFPETWRAFDKLLPLLAATHRVYAVDLRGFGDSAHSATAAHDSDTMAEDLHALIQQLNVGPVHLSGQDVSGAVVYRLSCKRPNSVASLTAIEMGLSGYGLEGFADVTNGGSWHIGAIATPGVADMLLAGRERPFLSSLLSAMTVNQAAVTDELMDEFVRCFSQPNGWCGATGLYSSMLKDGADIQALSHSQPLTLPSWLSTHSAAASHWAR